MRLSKFISENLENILHEWEEFAETLVPNSQKKNKRLLRDHAKQMLETIAIDLSSSETADEKDQKSKGNVVAPEEQSAATTHGTDRLESGFSIDAVMAEYRALRASVRRLWRESHRTESVFENAIEDIIRFNEAVDQAISESVASYSMGKEQQTRVFNTILSSLPDLSFTFNLNGKFAYANKAMTELFTSPLTEMIGKNFLDLKLPVAKELQQQIQNVVGSREHIRGEFPITAPSGEHRYYEYIFAPVFDEDDNVEAVAAIARNITERKAIEDAAWRGANYDALTKLPNRRLFHDRLDQEIMQAGRTCSNVALMFIDLDRFKEVNDEFGHDAGDALLCHVTDRIRACVRETDIVARLGGDEFTVVLRDFKSTQSVESVAAKIVNEMAKDFAIANKLVHISASVGIALFPQDAETPQQLLSNADQAMYASKRKGRSQFSFFVPDNDLQLAHVP